jgi:hypothetical protein
VALAAQAASYRVRLQILTIDALLKGARPDLPPLAIETAFRRPEREDRAERDQGSLLTAAGLDMLVTVAPTRSKRTRRPTAPERAGN